MARVHETQNTFWQSRLKETTFGTKIVAAGPFVRILTTDRSPWNVSGGTGNDGAYAHGSDRPENVWNTTHESAKSFPLDFNFQDIGYWLQGALGSVSSSGSTPDYEHLFTPQSMNTSRAAVTRTYGEKLGGTEINIYTSGAVNSLTISGARGTENQGRLSVSAEVMGNGKFDKDPASYVQPSLTAGLQYGYNQQASLTLADGVSINKSYTCDLASWSWNFNNAMIPREDNCGAEYATGSPESGFMRTGMEYGVRGYKFNFTAELETNDMVRTSFKAGTIFTITHEITSTVDVDANPFSLGIVHTRARLVEAPRSIGNNYNMISGTLELLSSAGAVPLTATLVNDVASYLV
jgi:hypothetical protein